MKRTLKKKHVLQGKSSKHVEITHYYMQTKAMLGTEYPGNWAKKVAATPQK